MLFAQLLILIACWWYSSLQWVKLQLQLQLRCRRFIPHRWWRFLFSLLSQSWILIGKWRQLCRYNRVRPERVLRSSRHAEDSAAGKSNQNPPPDRI
jgi:hypothetical protein